MNCDQVRDHLLHGGAPDAPEVAAHARECTTCSELVSTQALVDGLRSNAASEGAVGQLTLLQDKVRADLAHEAAPSMRLKSLSTRGRLALALALVAAVAAVEGTLLHRVDLYMVPLSHLVPALTTLGVLAVLGAWMSLRPLFRKALPISAQVALLIVGLAVPVALSFVQPETGHPANLKGSGPDLGKYIGICLAHGLSLAAVVWLGFRALDRQALSAGLAPLTAGIAASLVATLGLQLHCPIPTVPHWLFGHAAVGGVVLVTLLIRRRWSDRS